MKFVKLADARAAIEQLLDEVERGETIIITRGVLPRRKAGAPQEQWRTAMQDLRDLKKGAGLASIEDLLQWREEQRKAARGQRTAPARWI
ncbi:prevent-host-death family protein [Rhodopseudomonas palustris TIE-1]|uniref:type II toxin-antitoxin system Phd/YefM family antitoxin n=1 Tax=Rhodopseudomonas palustris TaxID=1076 RepID=UPI000164BC21|nr:prevent-host-death family protein [Rhodopseudomonas palustris]ACE98807.1 prevent-host-death family protein [Rhodopseudomonas palustris TIE-1]